MLRYRLVYGCLHFNTILYLLRRPSHSWTVESRLKINNARRRLPGIICRDGNDADEPTCNFVLWTLYCSRRYASRRQIMFHLRDFYDYNYVNRFSGVIYKILLKKNRTFCTCTVPRLCFVKSENLDSRRLQRELYSGIWGFVVWYEFTEISEERNTSIFTVEEWVK
jgi:hypothetical protein